MRLDNEYSIKSDGVGSTLIFETPRQREKEGVMVDFTYTDKWYFINVPQALTKYMHLKLDHSKDVKDCLKRIEEVEQLIKSIK